MLHKKSAEESSGSGGEQGAAPMQVDVELANTNTLVGDDNRRGASWDLVQGPKNYISLVSAQAASALFSFAAVWIATRYLGPAGYGGVVAIIAASQCVGQLTVNWTAISLSRYGCEEFVETGRIAKTFWARLLVLVSSLLVVTATFPLWLPLLSRWLHIPLQAYPLVLGHLLVTAFWIHVQQGLQGAKLLRLQGGLLTLERALIFLTLVALGLSGKAFLFSVALAYILAPLAVCAIGLWRLHGLIYPGVRLDRESLKRILIFSLPLFPSSLIGYFSTSYLDALFITHFLSILALGLYSVAYQLSGTVLQLPLLAGSLLLPLFVTTDQSARQERITRFLGLVLPLLTLVWSILCVALAAVASFLVPLVFGAQFREVVPALWPLMASAALAGPVLMGYFPISNTKAMTYVTAVNATISACLNVALNFILIPRFGLLGCAWATVVAFAVSTVVTAYLIGRRFPASRDWAPLATLPAIVGAASALWTPSPWLALLLAGLTAVVLIYVRRESIKGGVAALRAAGAFEQLIRMRFRLFPKHGSK